MALLPATEAKLMTGRLVRILYRGEMGNIERPCIHDPDSHGNTWCGSYFVRTAGGMQYREKAEDLIPVPGGGF